MSGLQVHKRWKTGREIVSDSQSSDGRSMQQVSQSFQRIIDQLVQQHLAEITEIAHIHFPQDRGNKEGFGSKIAYSIDSHCIIGFLKVISW